MTFFELGLLRQKDRRAMAGQDIKLAAGTGDVLIPDGLPYQCVQDTVSNL
jgi:hypothetical protein